MEDHPRGLANPEESDRYEVAVIAMLQRTGTTCFPRAILQANGKLYARIRALRTVAEAPDNALQNE